MVNLGKLPASPRGDKTENAAQQRRQGAKSGHLSRAVCVLSPSLMRRLVFLLTLLNKHIHVSGFYREGF